MKPDPTKEKKNINQNRKITSESRMLKNTDNKNRSRYYNGKTAYFESKKPTIQI